MKVYFLSAANSKGLVRILITLDDTSTSGDVERNGMLWKQLVHRVFQLQILRLELFLQEVSQ